MYLYPRLFPHHILAAEAARERAKARHKEDMRRRQRVAEERAERVFADLEKGAKFEDGISSAADTQVKGSGGGQGEKTGNGEGEVVFRMTMTSDFRLPEVRVLDVYVLPVMEEGGLTVNGLVVQPVRGAVGQHQRLGTFSTSRAMIAKLSPMATGVEDEEMGTFLLV